MGKTQLHPDEDQIHFMFPKQVKLIVSKINPLETSGMFIYSHSNYCGIFSDPILHYLHIPSTSFLCNFLFVILLISEPDSFSEPTTETEN